jgi:hypothetical protein
MAVAITTATVKFRSEAKGGGGRLSWKRASFVSFFTLSLSSFSVCGGLISVCGVVLCDGESLRKEREENGGGER